MKESLKLNSIKILALLISYIFILNFIPLTESAYADQFVIDFESTGLENFTYSQTGGIEIKTVAGNKYLNISPTEDGVTTVANFSFTPKAKLPVEISYDFMINDYMNNGICVASVTNGADSFLRLEVRDGSLENKNSSGLYSSLVNNLIVNKWYKLKLVMDFDNNKYSVYVDDVCVLVDRQSLATYSYTGSEVKLSLSSKYTPGFAVDNFITTDMQTMNRVSISGDRAVSLADGQKGKLEFTASTYDSDDVLIENCVYDALVKPEENGATASVDGNKITVNFAGDSPAGKYDLYVICGKVVQQTTITLERYEPSISEIEVLGDGKIAYGFNDNFYPFTVKLKDQTGEILDSGEIYYVIEDEIPENLHLDNEKGVITVTGELPKDKFLELKAYDVNNPDVYGIKQLVLTDSQTYASDLETFNVVKEHIENIWKYAQDPYNGSPLLANAIDRLTLSPAYWPLTPDEGYVVSNMAAVQQLFRASDTIYKMTGEEKYRKRVDDANLFFLQNFTGPNGLPYWGGHEAINLEELKYQKTINGHHELKGHDPYMESFYRVDPEWSQNFTMACFVQHIYDWHTMDMNRHGSYTTPSDFSKFYSAASKEYVPSNIGYSPVYTYNLGFAASLYGFSRLCTDMYRHTKSEYAANAFMMIFDAFWRVSGADPDMWLDVPQNSTAGRKGYPDEAVEGVHDIPFGPDGKWWLLDPIPTALESLKYGDRYWRARGDDLIDQGYITEENQWAARECYFLNNMEYNPPALYWDFVDAVGNDHPYADIVVERAIRTVANYIRLAYDPSTHTFCYMLIDGTDLTGFVCKRNGYHGGAGQSYKRYKPTTLVLNAIALDYAKGLDYPQYKEQTDLMWMVLKDYCEDNDLGIIGTNKAGDEGTELNINTSNDVADHILTMLYLFEASGNTQFLDMARNIAKNFLETHIADGFIVDDVNCANIFTGGRPSNNIYVLTLLEAATRGIFEDCSMFVEHTGFREEVLFIENKGIQSNYGNEYSAWEVPMPSIKVKELYLPKKEIELKVGEVANIEYTVYPDDAKDKSVIIYSKNSACVSADTDKKIIQGIKPGTTEITVRSNADIMIKDTIKVTVVE